MSATRSSSHSEEMETMSAKNFYETCFGEVGRESARVTFNREGSLRLGALHLREALGVVVDPSKSNKQVPSGGTLTNANYNGSGTSKTTTTTTTTSNSSNFMYDVDFDSSSLLMYSPVGPTGQWN
jgi:hypothetical protein